jgi:threonyl-tRNA synthetase
MHRAPFGSMELFCGVFIEDFAASFITGLAPEQARILPISEKSLDYAREVQAALTTDGVSIRGEEEDASSIPLATVVEGLKAEIAERRATLSLNPA